MQLILSFYLLLTKDHLDPTPKQPNKSLNLTF
jgi:hypothetical protein